MTVQNILLSSESFTHENWVYRDVSVGFSRLYYVIDGEAYYEENGRRVRFQPGHLYLTPVKRPFTLYENPSDKLLHTYAHITTLPAVESFTEIKVEDGTPLADAVALWRRHVHTDNAAYLSKAIELVLSCVNTKEDRHSTLARQARAYLDELEEPILDFAQMCRTLGYSREHVTRSFSSAYRTTPHQYFQAQRMNRALRQLMEGASVGATADAMGYATPYAFSKAFKKHFGLSPEPYLALLHQEPNRPTFEPYA